jgi:hypothetical protein
LASGGALFVGQVQWCQDGRAAVVAVAGAEDFLGVVHDDRRRRGDLQVFLGENKGQLQMRGRVFFERRAGADLRSFAGRDQRVSEFDPDSSLIQIPVVAGGRQTHEARGVIEIKASIGVGWSSREEFLAVDLSVVLEVE